MTAPAAVHIPLTYDLGCLRGDLSCSTLDDGTEDDAEHAKHDADLSGDVAAIGWRCMSVKTKGMSRARGDKHQVIPVVLKHILRQGDASYRAKHPHCRELTPLNSVLAGDGMADELAVAAHALLDGVGRDQFDNVMTWTLVCVLPIALDADRNWQKVLKWAGENPVTGGLPLVNATVHRDQPGVAAHLHIVVLPLRDGVRLKKPSPDALRGFFSAFCRAEFGVRVDMPAKRRKAKLKPTKTMGDVAASAGRGARSQGAAEARDAALMARIDPTTGELLALPVYGIHSWASTVTFSGLSWDGLEPVKSREWMPKTGHTQFSPTASTPLHWSSPSHPKTVGLVAADADQVRAETDRLRQRLDTAIDQWTTAEARAVIDAHNARKLAAAALDHEDAAVMPFQPDPPAPVDLDQEGGEDPTPILNTAGVPITHLSLNEFGAACAAECRLNHQGDALAASMLVERVFFPRAALRREREACRVDTPQRDVKQGGYACRMVRRLKAVGALVGYLPNVRDVFDDTHATSAPEESAGLPRSLPLDVKAERAAEYDAARDGDPLTLLGEAGEWLTRSEISRYSIQNGHPGFTLPASITPVLQRLLARGLIAAKPSGKSYRHTPVDHYAIADAGRKLLQRRHAAA